MKDEHIEHVLELYKNRKDVDKEVHLATFEEIKENDFNLNIPRYVDTSEPEEEIDLNGIISDMKKTDEEIESTSASLVDMLNDLTCSDDNVKQSLKDMINILGGK